MDQPTNSPVCGFWLVKFIIMGSWDRFPLGKPSTQPYHLATWFRNHFNSQTPSQRNAVFLWFPHQKWNNPLSPATVNPWSTFAGADAGSEGHDVGFENVGLQDLGHLGLLPTSKQGGWRVANRSYSGCIWTIFPLIRYMIWVLQYGYATVC